MRTRVWGIGSLCLPIVLLASVHYTPPEPRPRTELIRCGRGSGDSETKVFGPDQTDSLMVSGHKLIVPAGALSEEAEFTMWELPTPLIKVRLRAGDREHFPFVEGRHAVLAVSYARCSDTKRIMEEPVSVFRLRSDESEDAFPLDTVPLPSNHEPEQSEVRANLSRLSGYGVGWLTSPVDQDLQ